MNMDIDYILAGLMLGSCGLIAAFLIGFSKGSVEGFRNCNAIWTRNQRLKDAADASLRSRGQASVEKIQRQTMTIAQMQQELEAVVLRLQTPTDILDAEEIE